MFRSTYIFLILSLAANIQLNGQIIDPPLITHMSIDSISGQVEINWANASPQTEGYIVYKRDFFGLWIPLDTIYGIENTFYETSNSSAEFLIETFSITAFDGNDNSSLRSDFHQTMKLEHEYELCQDSCSLSWNAYHNMFALNGYLLQVNSVNVDNGQTNFIEYSLGVNDTDITIPIDYSNEYTIYVVAYNALDSFSVSSSSNFISTNLISPSYIYLNKVTINKDQSLEISIISDSSDVSYYEVYRSNFLGLQPVKIGETDSVVSPNSFIDPFIYPDINKYYYSAIAVDRCQNRIRRPNPNSTDTSVVHNLRLQSFFSDYRDIDLQWGSYDGFLNTDVVHELWKDVNGNQELIYEVQPNSQTNVEIINDIGKVCLFVKAYEQEVNVIGRQDTIHSNSICINNIPKIYIPSAFTPNDDFKNNIFKVEIYDNGSLESYSLKIYDLFSNLVFQTNDENVHWDGKSKNRDLPIDTYVYFMELTYGEGQIVTKNGNITLLR